MFTVSCRRLGTAKNAQARKRHSWVRSLVLPGYQLLFFYTSQGSHGSHGHMLGSVRESLRLPCQTLACISIWTVSVTHRTYMANSTGCSMRAEHHPQPCHGTVSPVHASFSLGTDQHQGAGWKVKVKERAVN